MAKKSAKRTMKKSSGRKAAGSKSKASKKSTKKVSKKSSKKSTKKAGRSSGSRLTSMKKSAQGMMTRAKKPMKKARRVINEMKDRAGAAVETVTKVVATAAGTVVGAVESVMPEGNGNETGSSST